MTASFINDNLVVLDGVNRVFKGIVRGQSMEPITYFYNDKKELDSFILSDWMYIDRPSNNDDLAFLMDATYSKMDSVAKDKFTSNLVNGLRFSVLIGDTNQQLTHQQIADMMIDAYDYSVSVNQKLLKRGVI